MGAPDRALRIVLGVLNVPSSGAANSEWHSSELIVPSDGYIETGGRVRRTSGTLTRGGLFIDNSMIWRSGEDSAPYLDYYPGTIPVRAGERVRISVWSAVASMSWAQNGIAVYFVPPVASPVQRFPIGHILMSAVEQDPADWLGYGAWERFGQGRVLVGVSEADMDFNAGGKTGGAKSVALSVEQMPAHAHRLKSSNSADGNATGTQPYSGGGFASASQYMENTGGGQAHNNMPPYVTVFMYKRVA
jgi:hypothetical protein